MRINCNLSLSSHNPFWVPQNTLEVGGQKTRLCRLDFYVYVYECLHVCVWCPWRPGEAPGTELTDD